jgi:hypothetical protein
MPGRVNAAAIQPTELCRLGHTLNMSMCHPGFGTEAEQIPFVTW